MSNSIFETLLQNVDVLEELSRDRTILNWRFFSKRFGEAFSRKLDFWPQWGHDHFHAMFTTLCREPGCQIPLRFQSAFLRERLDCPFWLSEVDASRSAIVHGLTIHHLHETFRQELLSLKTDGLVLWPQEQFWAAGLFPLTFDCIIVELNPELKELAIIREEMN